MSNISNLRDAADYLLEQGKYDDAFAVYDEVYKQIWGALGSVHSGLANFSQVYLSNNLRSSIEFRNNYINNAANTIFVKWFDLDLDQTLNEFSFTVFGHLQCICYSQTIHHQFTMEKIFNEFLILQTLILNGVEDKWVPQILKLASPMIDDNRIKRVRPLLTDSATHKFLIDGAEKLNGTDWYGINISILDYLFKIGQQNSELFKNIKKIVGPYSSNFNKNHKQKTKTSEKKKKEDPKSNYEKYEKYERYEKYEKYEKRSASQEKKKEKEFDLKTATEYEKAKYFGNILGLEGKLTKAQIRKKYYESIAKYHPDKVHDLGAELKELAERKTKEINGAYEWLKKKHNI